MKKTWTVLLLCAALLASGLPGTAAEPLRLTADLEDRVEVELNDQASYIYAFRYPQVDPSESSAELVNGFYQYLAEDTVGFEIPMNADYYRSQNPAEDIRVNVDYEVTCNNDDFFSVLIHTTQQELETWAGHTFSRKGLKAGNSVALPYLLGLLESGETDTWLQDRQKVRADALVREMVWDRLEESEDITPREDLDRETLDYGFFPEEDFYLNAEGIPVFYLQPGLAEDSGRLLTFPISVEEILDEM